MKEKLFILIVVLFAFNTALSAQKTIYITDKYDRKYLIDENDLDTTTFGNSRILKKMKLEYKKPSEFKEIKGGTECFEESPGLCKAFTCLLNQICSKDEQFIAFMNPSTIYTKDFQKYMEDLFPGKTFDLVDKQHFNQMKEILKSFYGEEMEQKWREKVITYPKYEAQKKFNADNAYRFSIALAPEDYYKKNFKYVDLLFLQKKGRGYVYFCCFYTDKAKAKLNNYWSKIEKVLHYKD